MSSIDLVKRRKELAERIIKGETLEEVAMDLADKYDKNINTIKHDWYDRDEWLDELLGIDNPEVVVQDIFREQEMIRDELWELVAHGDNDSVRKGALKELMNLNDNIIETYQSLGEIEKEPDKQEVEVSGDKFSINIEESDGDGEGEDD